jgi:signal transduction histidine kinase
MEERELGVRLSHPALLARLERGTNAPAMDTAIAGGHAGTDATSIGEGVYAGVPRWIQRLLRIPLPAKLLGANTILLFAATTTALVLREHALTTAPLLKVAVVTFVLVLTLNICLVMLAVHPLRVLEMTVDAIWHGDLNARVPSSLLADKHVSRIARMFNILLDGLVADRARTRRLAVEIIEASDKERAAISRELHDSAAQSLAALAMQLGVLGRSATGLQHDVLVGRIEDARSLAANTLEEIRLLAHTMHPRLLDELGLIAALRRLARDTTEHTASLPQSAGNAGIKVTVAARDHTDSALSAPTASVLYRVAQEAVQNARKHAHPTCVEIRLNVTADEAVLQIVDDGRGFVTGGPRDEKAGIGLFTMRERVALVNGEFQISSRSGGGTSVSVTVPLRGASPVPRIDNLQ